MDNNIKSGTIVKHITFGEGIVLAVKNDIADVNFFNVGKKTVLLSYISACDTSGYLDDSSFALKNAYRNKISSFDIIYFSISKMKSMNVSRIGINKCINYIKSEFYDKTPSDFIVQSLDPLFGFVFLNHLIKKEKKISTNRLLNKTISLKNDIYQGENFSNDTSTIDDFEYICTDEKFDTTVKLFFARIIINFAANLEKVEDINILLLKSASNEILNYFLQQMAIGYFYNDINKNNPSFYNEIFSFVQNNNMDELNKKESINLIEYYLKTMLINQFLIINGKKSERIYTIDSYGNLLFNASFVALLRKNGDKINKQIVSRLKYFFVKNNNSSPELTFYYSLVGKEISSDKFVIVPFEYNTNLKLLSEEITDDIILKNDFKALMKKYGIPANDSNLKICLGKLDYSLKSKRLILNNKYKTITAYYREQVLKEDVYRYSNPYNLDEYDTILKNLNLNLDLIDVGYGVYLTRTNMEKNGITDFVIDDFKKTVTARINTMKFMSLKEIMDVMKDNKVIEYCGGDKKQLIQFIKPISDIGINELSSGSYILCIKSSKHYKGDFIEFIFGKALSMDIYDIHDLALKFFDVEYSIEEIERDLKYTSLYYSEEMEKVYKNKQLFIAEVFGNGY